MRREASPIRRIEFYDSYEQAVNRFRELRSEPYNSEKVPGARLTFGVQRRNRPALPTCSMCARAKTTWWTIIPGWRPLNQSPEVMGILKQMRKDLGFDRVRAYEPGAMEPKDVTFSRWKHPLKPMARKSVLKELRESHSKEAAGKLPRKHKEKRLERKV